MINEKKKTKFNFFNFTEAVKYIFRSNKANKSSNFNIRAMHLINKIAFFIFLIGIIIIIIRKYFIT